MGAIWSMKLQEMMISVDYNQSFPLLLMVPLRIPSWLKDLEPAQVISLWPVTCESDGPANDDCENAIALECDTTVTGSTSGASDSGQNPSPDVFYTYTGSGTEETVTLSLCDGGTDYDSLLRVFDDGCNLVNEIAGNDDFCGLQSEAFLYF